MPEATGSEQWYVWEVRLVAPDGEEHAWVEPLQLIEASGVRDFLLATDPDFREIVARGAAGDSPRDIRFDRFPFDQPYESEGFSDYTVAYAVAYHHAMRLWEDGVITHFRPPR